LTGDTYFLTHFKIEIKENKEDESEDDDDWSDDDDEQEDADHRTLIQQTGGKSLWIKEVLHRTKGLPLWIRGSRITTGEAAKLALEIVYGEWDRIEQVIINFLDGADFTSSDVERWSNVLSHPAPCMYNYGIRFYGRRDYAFTHPFLSGSNAPSLTRLSVVDYSIDTGACWVSKLRELRLGTHDTLPTILQALCLMPLLEELSVDSLQRHEGIGSDSMYPHIRLKNLKSLQITMAIRTSSKMLECITPAAGCSISITARSMRPIHIEEEVMHPFSNCAKGLIRDYSLKRLKISISGELVFRAWTPGTEAPSFNFYLGAFYPGGKHNHTTVEGFGKAFIFEELSCITEFELEFGQHGGAGATLTRNFTPFFDHIIAICIGQSSLLNLFNAYCANPNDETPALFPNLETFQILNFNTVPVRGKAVTASRFKGIITVLQFLRDAGRPIRVLDLTLCLAPVKPSFQFSEVEELSGLKIIWRQSVGSTVSEYVCGSGRPEDIPLWSD